MSLEHFWPTSFEEMSKPSRRTEKKTETQAKDGDQEKPSTANAADSNGLDTLDPALSKAFLTMTKHLTQVIDDKLSPLLLTVQANASALQQVGTRLDEMEVRVDAAEGLASDAGSRVQELEKQVLVLTERMDGLEDRSKRKNLRIYGVPEGLEGGDPVKFFEAWIPKLLNIETKTGAIKLDRCHRLGPNTNSDQPGRGPPPRCVILRLHNPRDKKRVLDASRRAAEDGKQLRFQGSRISFYPDYSQGTLRKRKAFDEVRKQLREKKVEYATLHTGALRIRHNVTTTLHVTPEKAMYFINSLA